MNCRMSTRLTSCALLIAILCITHITPQEITFDGQPAKSGCRTADGKEGSCIRRLECKTLSQVDRVKTCGFSGRTRIICCPNTVDSGSSGGIKLGQVNAPPITFECGKQGFRFGSGSDLLSASTFARKKRNTGTDFNFDESKFEAIDSREIFQVVGGEISIDNSWPWMVLLGAPRRGNIEDVNWFCDGVLINEQWILTAAHCMNVFENFIVRLGEHDLTFASPTVQDIGHTQFVVHPNYGVDGQYEDLALVKLASKVVFTDSVLPACLPWGKEGANSIIGRDVTLTGWGTTEFAGASSPVLREAIVTVFPPATCESSYSTLFSYEKEFPRGMTEENVICAGNELGGVDACQGDSGGPIVLQQSGLYTVVGIVSKGHGCGRQEFPGIYAPVAPTLQWIKDTAF